MGSHCSFGHLKHKLWPKEGSGIKLALIPDHKKSRIDPKYLAAEGRQHTIGKISTKTTTLLQTAFQSEVCAQSYCTPKSRESQLGRFLGLPLGSPGTKSHLDVGSTASHRVYYKGEGGGFPQIRAVMNLVCPCCPWLVLAPKVLQLCTKHFVWVLCRPV